MVAKRARCFARAPRPLLRMPWARACGLTRIAARFGASHVLCVGARGVFHRVFAGIGSSPLRSSDARFKSCVGCNCGAGRSYSLCLRLYCECWDGHAVHVEISDSRVCDCLKTQTPVLGRRLGRSEYASARWASWGRARPRTQALARRHTSMETRKFVMRQSDRARL